MMTVAEAVRAAKLRLDGTAGEESLQQAKILAGFTLGIDENALMLHHQMELSREQIEELGGYLARRAEGEPLQYILGEWRFMGLPFYTDSRALIPRQDTETLCEAALAMLRERGYRRVLDVCCGSGCIGISLAALGGAEVTAADISPDCIALTQENAVLNGVSVAVVCDDLFRGVSERFDMIVCNPPYLSREDMDACQRELKFEPESALYGGLDGLDFYRRIARDYAGCLNEGGALLMEIGAAQAEAATRLFEGARILKDINGLPRVAVVEDRYA